MACGRHAIKAVVAGGGACWLVGKCAGGGGKQPRQQGKLSAEF